MAAGSWARTVRGSTWSDGLAWRGPRSTTWPSTGPDLPWPLREDLIWCVSWVIFCFWFCFVDLIDFVLWILWILFCGFMDFIFDCVCLWILLCGFMDFVNFVLWNFALWIYGCCFWFCFVIYCGLFCGFCFVDLWSLCLMSVGLWSLWIFVWCCNSGDGFAQEWSGPAVEALVGEGGDRSEEAEAFAVVRRWSGAASVSHRRWADIGRLDLDHVSRWKWRILSLSRGWPGILEWRCLTTSSFGMAKSLTSSFGMTKSNNLTSSFAPSGLERHEGVEP